MPRSTDDVRDELLTLRCQRGDIDAWDQLVARYSDRLFYFLRRCVSDDQLAAQLLQDVWFHVLRGLGTLRQGERLAPWLYTIARRQALTHYREQYAAAPQQTDAPLESVADDFHSAVDQFENAELVHFGLSRIGLAARELLTLYFLEDLSIAEIAGVLGIPAGTVKSRLWHARSELRRVLERETGPRAAKEQP